MQAGKNIQASQLHDYSLEYPIPCYGGNGIRGYVSIYSHDGTYPIIGRQGALCGNVKIASDKFYATEHAVVVQSFAETNVYLWFYFLENLNLNQYATATAQPGLSVTKIEELLIPLPPINEQHRIVSKIKKSFSLLEVIGENVALLSDTVASTKSKILDLAMQGKLVPQDPADEPAADMLRRVNPKAEIIGDNPHSWNIPKSWVWCRLGDIFFHNTGKALNSSNHEGKLLPYLTTSNVYWERFELETVKSMYFKESELDKCSIYDGDLLVCEGGDVGRAAIWDNTETMMIQNHLHRLRPKGNEILSHFYLKVFKHYKEKDLIGGKGIGLLGFSSKVLHNLVVPLPPFEEQRRIIEAFNTLFETLDEIEASLQA